MAYVWADRVLETSTTTGTGALTLTGAVTQFRTFASVCSVSDTLPYVIINLGTSEWEVGLGTYSGVNTLTRTTVQASSNAGAAVNFSAGTKRVGLSNTALSLLPLASGGTAAATAGGARTNLGLIAGGAGDIWVEKAGDTMIGNLELPAGSFVAPSLRFTSTSTTGLFGISTNGVGCSVNFIVGDDTRRNLGQSIIPLIQTNRTASDAAWGMSRWSAASATAAASFIVARSRGAAVGTNSIVSSGDSLGNIFWHGDDGSGFQPAVSIRAEVDGTPGSGDMPGRIIFSTTADGVAAVTERVRFDSAGNIGMGGANTVIDSDRLHRFRAYTVATLPAAGTAGRKAYVTDALAPTYLATLVGGGAVVTEAFDNGTNWVGT